MLVRISNLKMVSLPYPILDLCYVRVWFEHLVILSLFVDRRIRVKPNILTAVAQNNNTVVVNEQKIRSMS